MRIYWVLFGIFCINAAMVNSMGVPGTGVFESMTRTKRADEKPVIFGNFYVLRKENKVLMVDNLILKRNMKR